MRRGCTRSPFRIRPRRLQRLVLETGRGSRFPVSSRLAKFNEPMIERYVGKQIENRHVDSGAGQRPGRANPALRCRG